MLRENSGSIELAPMEANAALCVALQHVLDTIAYIHAGFASVTEANFRNNPSRFSFQPSSNNQLPYHSLRSEAERWLLKGMITEAVDRTGAFLEEIFCMALLVEQGFSRGEFSGNDFIRARENALPRFHKLGFPQKLDYMRSRFNISSPYERQFLTLNRLRNCMVHRGGVVGELDADANNELRIVFHTQFIFARSQSTGIEYPVKFNAPVIPQEANDPGPAQVGVGWHDPELVFKLGDQVALTFDELGACTLTIWAFSREMCASLLAYIQSRGVPLGPPTSNV